MHGSYFIYSIFRHWTTLWS